MRPFTLSRFSHIENLPQPPDVPGPSDGRYQPVLGTVAYDGINKRMNVTTMIGVNGKASGRLKSYKFCEGAQQFDVTLPVGDSGDFICMVTHATDPAMTNGIGVGLQSDGAGNWNLVTLSGTTVTVGASSGLVDGKTARIEIEKDITGAYWYYIYDAVVPKPTTATGKLFTTLTEGYTGWYANGAGAETQTFAIDNISIRAESIVGRTNVEVTEDVFNSVTGEIEARTYFKPIHRGAMLETYHDGTQEVVGTTFIDDCQWDRSAEYAGDIASYTWDTVNGRVYTTVEEKGVISQQEYGDGSYLIVFKYNDSSSTNRFHSGLILCSQDNDTRMQKGNKYSISYHIGDKRVYAQRIMNDSQTQIGSTLIDLPYNASIYMLVIVKSPVIDIYISTSGAFTSTPTLSVSDSTFTSGKFGFSNYLLRGDGTSVEFSFLSVIAASPDATNGIAACIPPIGGGARYGMEESVYNTFTTANVDKGVYLTSAKVKTTNPNADEVSLECTNDTTSITLNTTPIDVDATYTVKTAPITIDANETDTLRVSVKNSTTYDQSAIYVDSLSLIPVSGDDVLYPQDLAFISSVKPSQKRKVEVK